MESQNENKCTTCGKSFRDMYDLNRHKSRKTPCVGGKSYERKAAKTFECIMCKNKFTTKGSLTKHSNSCKNKPDETYALLLEEVKELKEWKSAVMSGKIAIIESDKANISNKFVNKGTFNQQNISNDITANFNVNPYDKPDTSKMHIDLNDRTAVRNISKHLFKNLYFNPEVPENHSLYLKNKKDIELVVKGPEPGSWRTVRDAEERQRIMNEIGNIIILAGQTYINGTNGPYGGSDQAFKQLDGSVQNELLEFNGCKKTLTEDTVIEVMTDGRSVVLPTLKRVDCPMLK